MGEYVKCPKCDYDFDKDTARGHIYFHGDIIGYLCKYCCEGCRKAEDFLYYGRTGSETTDRI